MRLTTTTFAALLGLVPLGAAAHAVLIASDPRANEQCDKPPERVSVQYNHELDRDGSGVAVFDATGKRVDDGDGGVNLYDPDHASMGVDVSQPLAAGRYTVRWTAVSMEDGDATRGEFDFHVTDELTR